MTCQGSVRQAWLIKNLPEDRILAAQTKQSRFRSSRVWIDLIIPQTQAVLGDPDAPGPVIFLPAGGDLASPAG